MGRPGPARRMGRPRTQRATVQGLASESGGELVFPDGRSCRLDSLEFATFLSLGEAFAVQYEHGVFLAVADRRHRGSLYWMARAYLKGKRAATYLGQRPGSKELQQAAHELAVTLQPQVDDPPVTVVSSVIEEILAEMRARETDPDRRRAVEALADLARTPSV